MHYNFCISVTSLNDFFPLKMVIGEARMVSSSSAANKRDSCMSGFDRMNILRIKLNKSILFRYFN